MLEIVDNLIFMGIAASVIALLMLLVAWLGRNVFSGTWFQTGWIIAMLLLVIPVTWIIGRMNVESDFTDKILRLDRFRTVYIGFMDQSLFHILGISPDSAAYSSGLIRTIGDFPVKTVLFILWITGVIVLSAVKLYRYYSFRNMIIQKSEPSDERWIFAIPDQIRSKIKLRDAQIPSPFVFGIFRPTVVMPGHAENKEDICFALMHELLHIERKDLLTKTIAEAVAVLHWFNPFAWVIRNRVTLACENACDEAVADRLNEEGRKGYAMAILDFMDYSAAPEPNYPPTLMSFSGDADHVKTRLKNIMRYKKMSRSALAFSVCVILLVISIGILTGFSLTLSVKNARPDPAAETVPETEPSETVPIESSTETEPVENPPPVTEAYSQEIYVFSKGENTTVVGRNIRESISGYIDSTDEAIRYSSDRTAVAFRVISSETGRTSLYYSDGNNVTSIAEEPTEFHISSDGLTVVYATIDDGSETSVSIRVFRAAVGTSGNTISGQRGVFAISPDANIIAFSPSGSVALFSAADGSLSVTDREGIALAVSGTADFLYRVTEEKGKTVLRADTEEKSTVLFSGTDFSEAGLVRLILDRDRSNALIFSDRKAVTIIDGRRTVAIEKASGMLCPMETTILNRYSLPGNVILSVEEARDGIVGQASVFGVYEGQNRSKGVRIDPEGAVETVSIDGSVIGVSRDAFRVVCASGSGDSVFIDDVFGNKNTEPVDIPGTISSERQVKFAGDRSVYYLTEDGTLHRISSTGKPAMIAGDVSDFALVSVGGRTELFFMTDFRAEQFETPDGPVKRYGRSLYSAEFGAVGISRLVDTFVLRVDSGLYGVIYERVSRRLVGSSGCVASVDIYYGSNGKDFVEILKIG